MSISWKWNRSTINYLQWFLMTSWYSSRVVLAVFKYTSIHECCFRDVLWIYTLEIYVRHSERGYFRRIYNLVLYVVSYMAEHGNQPIFSTVFGKIVYSVADSGKKEHCRTLKFWILEDRVRQRFQSYCHWYCFNGIGTLFQWLNNVLVLE